MIELNKETRKDFLDRDWVRRLLDSGIDMSDARYYITDVRGQDYIVLGDPRSGNPKPTYTVSELYDKLPDWIYPLINGMSFSGGLLTTKTNRQYCCFYDLVNCIGKEIPDYIAAEFENPIEALASLLVQCKEREMI